jgi:uncharacterized protein YcbK (DUF882 family)
MVFKSAVLAGAVVLSSLILIEPLEARVTGAHRGLNSRLLGVLHRVSRHFGREVSVTSGCRSQRHNRRIGGARRSLHMRCSAADIRVAGVPRHQVLRVARALPGRGGIGTYCRTSVVHIDVGPRREWHRGCGKRKQRKHGFHRRRR